MKKIQKNLKEDDVNKIYTYLLAERGNYLNEIIIKFIVNFYSLDKEINIPIFLSIFKECNDKIKEKFLRNLTNYYPYEKDILEVEQTDKYKLFKGLLDLGIFENKNFKSIYYIERINDDETGVVSNIRDKLVKGELEWDKISLFYNNKDEKEKRENSLLDKLRSIFFKDEERANKYKLELDHYNEKINNKLVSLNLILEDFIVFFKKTQGSNIKTLEDLITKLKSGPINLINKKEEEIENLIKQFEEGAKERKEKMKSFFFINIYKANKNKLKNANEQILIDETENDFKRLKNIFNKEGIQTLDKDILKICLDSIKGKKREELSEEIDTLKKLFQVENSKEQKDKIINSLVMLSKKEDLYEISLSISIFINKAQLSQNELFPLVNEIIENPEKLNEEENIIRYVNTLNKYEIRIDSLYEPGNYLNILLILKKNPNSISFLLGKTENDCRNLQEAAGDNDSGFLNINDIKDFEECVKFMNNLGNIKQMEDVKFFQLLKKKVEENNNITLYFTKYANNFIELKNLFESSFDKSAASKRIINSICEDSEFILKNKKRKFFSGFYKIKKEKEEEISINKIKFDTLKELRDRAQLTKKVSNEPEEIKNFNNLKNFVKKVNIICKIYDIIKDIYSSGDINEIEIKIEIKNYEAKYKGCGLEETSESKKIIKKLKEELISFIKKQKAAYRDMPLIRYIYGRQLNLIYDKLYNNIDNDIFPLLMYISNNSEIKEYNFEFKIDRNKEIYFNIEKYIKEILRRNNKNFGTIQNNMKIIEKEGDSEYCGIYTFQSDRFNNNLQKNVLQIYKYLTKKNPKAQYILFCNKETTTEELTAFLYRAILCEYNLCFIIAGIELLQFKQKTNFQKLVNDLYSSSKKKMKSCLIIAYLDTEADIMKSVFTLKNRKSLRNLIEKLENQNIGNIDSKVEIVLSDVSGVGKSTYITSEIKKKKKDCIYFPLGGVFSRKDVLKRLNELKKEKNFSNGIFHLDLYDTEKLDLTMEFLFSILVTKIYGQNDDIFYMPDNVEIMVEIPNGFIDFMKKFPILNIFNKIELRLNNLLPLIVEEKLDNNIQIVANYLNLLDTDIKSLNNRDLYFKGINDNLGLKTFSEAKVLSQSKCQELIFSKIKEKIKNPNYYQISSFINVLGMQLRKFSQNNLLSVSYLSEVEMEDMRSYIINNFIKLTNYFTENGFIDLVNNQMKNYKKSRGNFDEDKDNQEAIDKLAKVGEKNQQILFEKLDPSLLIFEEGNGEFFSVISNGKNKEESKKYTNLMKKLGFSFNLDNSKDDDKQKVFLELLQNILGITNEIGKKEDYKNEQRKISNKGNKNKKKKLKKNDKIIEDDGYDEEEESEEEESEEEEAEKKEGERRKSLYEIKEKYVFTADNYLKMALILLRIRAKIPVIMMGETGCGKTALIRKLSEMLNNGDKNKMKILNIHAGTSDKDIIKFLEKKVIPKAKRLEKLEREKTEKYKEEKLINYEKQIWVFLDEINTCKSMGLISEMLCKHSYQGKSLPSNIAFIAACNPYRYPEKNKHIQKVGLDAKNATKQIEENLQDVKDRAKIYKSSQKSLIYTVNPLPHSLLNFVFDFGNLNENDEKEYITNMIEEKLKEFFDKYKNDENINDNFFIKIHELAINLIVKSQKFIRDENDKSSVSLREIRRFIIFYEFFFNYLKQKKETDIKKIENGTLKLEEDYNFYSNLTYINIQIYSIILSTFV